MEFSFKFSYGRSFLMTNIVGIAAGVLVSAISLAWLAFYGFSWPRLVFGVAFMWFSISSLTQMPVSLKLGQEGLRVKCALGRERIPLAQIEAVELPKKGKLVVKNALVRYSVALDKKPLVSIFVTNNDNIVILTRKVGKGRFRYAISCPSPEAATELCKTFQALNSE